MSTLQALQGELHGLADKVNVDRMTDEDRTRFNQYLHLFHQTRSITYLPVLPIYGDKRPDLLTLYKTVREQYGTANEMDMEDWLSVARLVKLRVHTVTNGLRLLKETFDNYLAPIDDPRTFQQPTVTAPPVTSLAPNQSLLFVPEIQTPPFKQEPLPAVLPHARLDLHRILLGLEDLEIAAFQCLDSLLILVAEGRWPEPRMEEISRCTAAVERAVVIGKNQKLSLVLNHGLHSLGLLLSRGVKQESILMCTEIFGDCEKFPIDTRVLAGKILTLIEGMAIDSPVVQSILTTCLDIWTHEDISDPRLINLVTTLLGRNVHGLTAKRIVFGFLPKFPSRIADTRCVGLMLLVIGNFADQIAKLSEGVAAVSVFVVKPLVDEISTRKISDPLWEAGVSVLLRMGVHPEMRRALAISDQQILHMCWTADHAEAVAVKSLWNVVSELLLIAD